MRIKFNTAQHFLRYVFGNDTDGLSKPFSGDFNLIAVGENSDGSTGVIYGSSDQGATWNFITVTPEPLTGVDFGNNRWVACGNTGAIYLSSDAGLTWDKQTVGTAVDFKGVTYTQALGFKVVGVGGQVATSIDGINWTNLSIAGGQLNRYVESSSGDAVVGDAGFVYDVDGATSRTSGTANNINSGTFRTHYVFPTDAGDMVTGTVLTGLSAAGRSTENLNDIADNGTTFVVVGDVGEAINATDPTAAWSVAVSGTTDNLNGVAHTGANFVSIGDSGANTRSATGSTWNSNPITQKALPYPVTANLKLHVAAAYNGLPVDDLLVKDGGNLVSELKALDGTSVTMTQGTGSLQPLYEAVGINGNPSVRFGDGGVKKVFPYTLAVADEYTFFIICEATSDIDAYIVGGAGGASTPALISGFTTGTKKDFEWFLNPTPRIEIAETVNKPSIIAVSYKNGGRLKAWLDGILVSDVAAGTGFATSTFSSLGGLVASASRFVGLWGDMSIHDAELSTADIDTINNFYLETWEIPSLKSVSFGATTPPENMITESGDNMITESGDNMTTEG